jgi:signal transduction histidine kinase
MFFAQGSRSALSNESAKQAVVGTRAWRSLGARLAVWYAVVTLASFAAVAAFVAIHTHLGVESAGQTTAENALKRYRDAFENGGTEALRVLVNEANGPRPSVAIRVTDQHEIELLTLSSDEASSHAATTLRSDAAAPGTQVNAPKDWHVAVAHISEGRRLEVMLRDDEAPRTWHNAARILWLILGGGLFAAITGAFVISRNALRPLSELAKTTQTIIESGDLSSRVSVRGSHDDLDQLAALFNRMLTRNEALMRAMKESLDNVAHDLRTPLTRLRTGAELALSEPVDASKMNEALADVIEETDRVLSLLTTLMDITEATTGVMHLDKHAEDLAGIAREAVELYEFVSAERGVHVLTQLSPGVEVMVDRRRAVQVCANLLDNAIKYTPAGGSVEVSVTSDTASGILTIADTGIGIAPEDRPRVWDRLFRGDRSRTEHGLGLGLSLVKAVVEAHGGEVRLRADTQTGSTFEVLLPLARSTEQVD